MTEKDKEQLRRWLDTHPTDVLDVVLDQGLPLKLPAWDIIERKGDVSPESALGLSFAGHGDIYVYPKISGSLAFCVEGRGDSPRVRNALAITAYAMQEANKNRPN